MGLSFHEMQAAAQEMSLRAVFDEDLSNYTLCDDGRYEVYTEYTDDAVSEVDKHKNITVNDEQCNLTQEENSQYVPFKLPRYWDGVDLMTKLIQFHYVNINGGSGVSTAVNVRFNDSYIICGWLINKSVTAVAGDVTFEITATGTNEKSADYRWRTRPNGKFTVLEALSYDGIIEPSDDWYAGFVKSMQEYMTKAAESVKSARDYADQSKSNLDQVTQITETFTANAQEVKETAINEINNAKVSGVNAVEAAAAEIVNDREKITENASNISSLKEDLGDLATFGKNQYIDSKTAKDNTLWRNFSGNITRSDGYSGFTTFPMINLAKGTYFISKKIWHKYTWVKNINGKIVALNTIDGVDGDTYSGVISFSEDVELYITIQTANLPLMVVDGDEEPPYYIDFGKYGKSLNGNYKVNVYTLSEIEKSAIRDYTKIDYHFVKNGKLVCNNSNPTSSGAVAKYTKADMGSNIVKAMCLFSARNGGNVTLISTPLDTDNNVQNIVNKSIHCIFGMSSCVAQTFLNGTAKTLGTITYPTLNNDDTTEYECGFEIINNNTLRLYAPNGKTLDCTGDWSEYNGNFFIYEEYNGKPSIGDTTSEWERPSIIAVFL